jgi:CheY-like chemotaxis protein
LTASVRIALVEDEFIIQEFMVSTLEEAGYDVVTASNGEEAISLLEAEGPDCRALITDIRLGPAKLGLTGWDVAHRARELNPDLPVVYVTGDSAADWASRGVPRSMLVRKPFVPAQIILAVSQLLNATG